MNDPSFPWLGENEWYPFPEPDQDGLVAAGGNLSPGLLLSAYRQGVFPWFNDDREPILWWNLDPRFILVPEHLRIPRTLKKEIRKKPFRITVDTAFEQVIHHCSRIKRKKQKGTWITNDMITAYTDLHQRGYAHSAEAWDGSDLAGGLYGVSLGSLFFGESMFSLISGASRQVLAQFAPLLFNNGFTMIDCQQETGHLALFGAESIPRSEFLNQLDKGLQFPTRKGKWTEWVEGGTSPC